MPSRLSDLTLNTSSGSSLLIITNYTEMIAVLIESLDRSAYSDNRDEHRIQSGAG